jgi:sigma-E factor negative regulatory protein RseC
MRLNEPMVILSGLVGFFAACLRVRWCRKQTTGDPTLQSVILHALLAGAALAF